MERRSGGSEPGTDEVLFGINRRKMIPRYKTSAEATGLLTPSIHILVDF